MTLDTKKARPPGAAPLTTGGQNRRTLPDGRIQIIGGEHDTLTDLYRLAYGKAAKKGGEIQFATWCFLCRNGPPVPGVLILVPPFEDLMRAVKEKSEAAPDEASDAGKAAIEALESGFTLTHHKELRQTLNRAQEAIHKAPATQGALAAPGRPKPARRNQRGLIRTSSPKAAKTAPATAAKAAPATAAKAGAAPSLASAPRVMDDRAPTAVMQRELAYLRERLAALRPGFALGPGPADGKRLFERLSAAGEFRDHSWTDLLVAAPDLATVKEGIDAAIVAAGFEGQSSASADILKAMSRAVATESIVLPVEEALHEHLKAAALRLDALVRHPEAAAAEAGYLRRCGGEAARDRLETLGLLDDDLVALLRADGGKRTAGDAEAAVATRLVTVARARLAALAMLGRKVEGHFKSVKELVELVPELTRQVAKTEALGLLASEFPFDKLTPVNAAQEAVADFLSFWNEVPAAGARLAFDIGFTAATGGIGVVYAVADLAGSGFEAMLETTARMVTKQALAAAGLGRQAAVRDELRKGIVSFVAGQVGGQLATKAMHGSVERLGAAVGDRLTVFTERLANAAIGETAELLVEKLSGAGLDRVRLRLELDRDRRLGAALLEGRTAVLGRVWAEVQPERGDALAAVLAAYCVAHGRELPALIASDRLPEHFAAFARQVGKAPAS
ncbi:MAG: hypothetical protein HY903_10055 [Deltaproteobacteria bacterium]|nr:hypothetical protein [Deltaproteobacteria bacterium]